MMKAIMAEMSLSNKYCLCTERILRPTVFSCNSQNINFFTESGEEINHEDKEKKVQL